MTPEDMYLDVTLAADGQYQAVTLSKNLHRAPYKKLSPVEQDSVTDVKTYRNAAGAELITVMRNVRSSFRDATYQVTTDYYRPAPQDGQLPLDFVVPLHITGESNTTSYGCRLEADLSLNSNTRIHITPESSIVYKDDHPVDVFNWVASDPDVRTQMFQENPDVHAIEYALRNGDEMIVVTAPANPNLEIKYYDNFHVYRIKDDTVLDLGMATEVDRFRDGGTTRGVFKENGVEIGFYVPSPYKTDVEARLDSKPVTELPVTSHRAIENMYGEQINVVDPNQRKLIRPIY